MTLSSTPPPRNPDPLARSSFRRQAIGPGNLDGGIGARPDGLVGDLPFGHEQ
jgi:hypothetical protein